MTLSTGFTGSTALIKTPPHPRQRAPTCIALSERRPHGAQREKFPLYTEALKSYCARPGGGDDAGLG
jgi:hypothetical protein